MGARQAAWRRGGAVSPEADGASGVAQASAVESHAQRRLVCLQRGIQHRLSRAVVEQQVAKVLVPVGPGRAVVVEAARNLVRASQDRDVVQAEVTMGQQVAGRVVSHFRLASLDAHGSEGDKNSRGAQGAQVATVSVTRPAGLRVPARQS